MTVKIHPTLRGAQRHFIVNLDTQQVHLPGDYLNITAKLTPAELDRCLVLAQAAAIRHNSSSRYSRSES